MSMTQIYLRYPPKIRKITYFNAQSPWLEAFPMLSISLPGVETGSVKYAPEISVKLTEITDSSVPTRLKVGGVVRVVRPASYISRGRLGVGTSATSLCCRITL